MQGYGDRTIGVAQTFLWLMELPPNVDGLPVVQIGVGAEIRIGIANVPVALTSQLWPPTGAMGQKDLPLGMICTRLVGANPSPQSTLTIG